MPPRCRGAAFLSLPHVAGRSPSQPRAPRGPPWCEWPLSPQRRAIAEADPDAEASSYGAWGARAPACTSRPLSKARQGHLPRATAGDGRGTGRAGRVGSAAGWGSRELWRLEPAQSAPTGAHRMAEQVTESAETPEGMLSAEDVPSGQGLEVSVQGPGTSQATRSIPQGSPTGPRPPRELPIRSQPHPTSGIPQSHFLSLSPVPLFAVLWLRTPSPPRVERLSL